VAIPPGQEGGQSAISLELRPEAVFAGRYRIEERIGAGGMGTVYRVHDLRLDEIVALKIMTFAAGEAAHRFVEEVRLARRVTHPNVARTHDIGEFQGVPYLTMEFAQGDTLEARIDTGGPLPPAEAAAAVAQIAAALEAAHAAGVIHRDLKPSNVILTPEGRAIVTDFGIARAIHGERDKRTVGIVGTPAYMSPEQASGGVLDARSDIYTLGIILYELLTARLPFEEEEPLAAALARLRRAPTHVSAHHAVPQALADLTMWMLATDPGARPGSAQVVRESLEAFIAGAAAPHNRTTAARALGAAISPGERSIAVLPFRFRGPAEHDFFADGLAEELIDLLSRTRGLKVLAFGATQRFADDRDPMRVGSALGADVVVDGRVDFAGGRLRLSTRLLDAKEGIQLWSDRCEVAHEDLFRLQEQLGKRLTEALRLELRVRSSQVALPPEAIELCMRARKMHRSGLMGGSEQALALLDRALELVPNHAPAIAAHAMCSVRAWWLEGANEAGARNERAKTSLERARALAADEPETPLAEGTFAFQNGDYRAAARAFQRTLEIAPTVAEAHQNLGNLEVEASRLRQGMARLELSLELDPGLNGSRLTLARMFSYDGRYEDAESMLAQVAEGVGEHHPGLLISRLRTAMQKDDPTGYREAVETIQAEGGILAQMGAFFRLGTGEIGADDAETLGNVLWERYSNPRFRMAIAQVGIEIFAFTGHHEHALRALAKVSGSILVDTVWLDRARVLVALRGYPAYAEAAAKIRHRAAATWSP
jgi:serine/threonine-protein kinase